ncbi:asparagine synthase (glutamine-hydrolyzing) [Terasakiella sp. SH-1]|uniref:asparagine synthase (glutamine-hydrolyzing) n=1 Tax=Terasakiella sp. SH-1 TaxID=2560057 RepID=UPI0010747217|nr:asparagine synthase (glutamine-hydrolyzing) [Terasakiella sp. SH-1]
MCGILGEVLVSPAIENRSQKYKDALSAISHRGPDGEGVWQTPDKTITLGHRRLAIIDLNKRAAQPMTRGELTITFNGEIYNFLDLKQELEEKGHKFTTQSDTEILLNGWRQWGKGLVPKLDGMFAFAIFDGTYTHIVTDPFGEKPVFLRETSTGYQFASELSALDKLLPLEKNLSQSDLYSFLTLGYLPGGTSAYKGVKKIDAGTIVTLNAKEVISETRYWFPPRPTLSTAPPRPATNADLERIRDALITSIERRLISDVPLSLFLSSGVDSTLVALMCRYELDIRPETLTFVQKGYLSGKIKIDESFIASQLAKYLGCPHHIVECDPAENENNIDDMLHLFGGPCDNSGAFSVKTICHAAKKNYVVGLTGVGGDELAYGYGKVATLYRFRKLHVLPHFLLDGIYATSQYLRPFSSKFQAIADRACKTTSQIYSAEKNYPMVRWLNKLDGYQDWCENYFKNELAPYLEAGYEDLNGTLPGSILFAQDHASMSESFELRTPFLSKDVFEAASHIDPRSMISFGRKNILKRLRKSYLKDIDFNIGTHGFLFSSNHLLKNLETTVPQINGIDSAFSEKVWHKRSAGEGWTRMALRLAILEKWQKT